MERDYGADVRDFLAFLDERKPAHFVAEALSSLLRTDPPVVFSAAVLVAIDPKLEGGKKKAWLFVTGFLSTNAIAVKVDL